MHWRPRSRRVVSSIPGQHRRRFSGVFSAFLAVAPAAGRRPPTPLQTAVTHPATTDPGSNVRNPPALEIAVAALWRATDAGTEVLIARRPASAIRGGLWELPGGKAEPGETPAVAAARELAEETGVTVAAADGVTLGREEQHDPHLAAERSIVLTLVAFEAPPGAEPRALGSDDCRWERIDRLGDYEWPAANRRLNALLPGLGRAAAPTAG
ncbi:MAG: NUDIX domain-containing protein [Phycisphaerales bacterium]|nr:NUDIX domain-containing protein [Phycisphaerales bacterium]